MDISKLLYQQIGLNCHCFAHEKQRRHSLVCEKSLWTLKGMAPSREAEGSQVTTIYLRGEEINLHVFLCLCIMKDKCMFNVHSHCSRRSCLTQWPCLFALTLDMPVNIHGLCGIAIHRADVLTSKTIQQF